MARQEDRLTPRQLEVLELMAKGLTNPEIGSVLGIATTTVKTHVAAVMQALGAGSRTEAAVALGKLGLERDDPAESLVPGFGARPPIAVLPFEGAAAEAPESWFTEGLTTDLCRKLGATRWLPVIDPDSSLTFGSNEPAQRAGRELGVRYVIQGSAARLGSRLALAVKLLHLTAGAEAELVWADRFEVDLDELVDAHRQVVGRIVGELAPALLEIDRVHHMRVRAEQIRVWEQCQQAAAWLRGESAEGFAQARALLEDAARVDPRSSRAWTGISNAWNDGYYLGFVAPEEYAGPARDAAHRALDLEPEDAEAHLACGRAFGLADDAEQALPHLERSIELNPSSSRAYNAVAGVLRRVDRIDEAIDAYHKARRISPRDPAMDHVHGGLSLCSFAKGEFEEALDHARRAALGERRSGRTLSFMPLIPAALALLGRVEEAREAFEGLRSLPARSLRHSARFAGRNTPHLAEGLRMAGWDGRLP